MLHGKDYGGASTCPACGACSALLNIGECEYCGERGCSSCMLQESDGTSWRLDCGCREVAEWRARTLNGRRRSGPCAC